uniref:Uncharacterized protein n=1 Tax=Sphaerodactylus townsendi TaxID=933632 RepID=A0ACB8G878_9SAUR
MLSTQVTHLLVHVVNDSLIYHFQNPTNGYCNIQAHEDRPSSCTTLYADDCNPGPTHYEARPSSCPAFDYSAYDQLSTYGGHDPTLDYSGDPIPVSTAVCITAGSASQLSYETYGGHTAFPPNTGYTQPPPATPDRAAYDSNDPPGKCTPSLEGCGVLAMEEKATPKSRVSQKKVSWPCLDLHVSWRPDSLDSTFTCLLSNPADQKSASLDLASICRSEGLGIWQWKKRPRLRALPLTKSEKRDPPEYLEVQKKRSPPEGDDDRNG